MFTAWNGETYANLGGLFDTISELETELDHEEKLRVAIWAWNNHEEVSQDTIGELIEKEQEQFAGEFDSVSDFVQDLLLNGDYMRDVPDWIVIDFETTWNSALRFDYFDYDVIDIDGQFRKFYWRAY
jgi:antirestriction protein